MINTNWPVIYINCNTLLVLVNALDTDTDINIGMSDDVFDGNAFDKENIPVQHICENVNEKQRKRKTPYVLTKSLNSPHTSRNIGPVISSRKCNKGINNMLHNVISYNNWKQNITAYHVERSSAAEQLHSSKQIFECIAQKQADAMMVKESWNPDLNWSKFNFCKIYEMTICYFFKNYTGTCRGL